MSSLAPGPLQMFLLSNSLARSWPLGREVLSKGRRLVMDTDITTALFVAPSIVAEPPDADGSLKSSAAGSRRTSSSIPARSSGSAWVCTALLSAAPLLAGAVIAGQDRSYVCARARHNAAARSAARIERLLVMARPADLDAGEITDKGYVNQRRVLANRQNAG